MTGERLTAILAEKVMGWSVGPDRFLMGNRRWQPRWRFQPTENLDDAFRVLEKAAPQEYAMGDHGKGFYVRVRVGKRHGRGARHIQAAGDHVSVGARYRARGGFVKEVRPDLPEGPTGFGPAGGTWPSSRTPLARGPRPGQRNPAT